MGCPKVLIFAFQGLSGVSRGRFSFLAIKAFFFFGMHYLGDATAIEPFPPDVAPSFASLYFFQGCAVCLFRSWIMDCYQATFFRSSR